MAHADLTIVLSYDISRAATRRRVAKRLEETLCRVQMSVFEGRLKAFAANRLFEETEALIDPGDSLRMYVLTATGLEKSRQSGGAPLPEKETFWLM
ncbi:MAG: CRISPR-associated endonuclease Cas2 [Rhizobiaceae bacterium]|nr:CRISPR-associated endonuclease Cas2 [Rhizobiaceae bacterium]